MKQCLVALASCFSAVLAISVEPGSLRTEGVEAPIGIHPTTPMLSWRLASDQRGDAQTAYQVQASSRLSSIDDADLWDTGKVSRGRAFAVWDGETLTSRKQVYWRTRVWDIDDSASDWSEPSKFELGLLDPDDWSAGWIENSEYATGVNSLPMFARDFEVDCAVNTARLYITGLGAFRAEINGGAVSDEVMGPGYTTINRTINYRAYDVTDMLKKGDNVIGVAVGKGIYNSDKGMLGR